MAHPLAEIYADPMDQIAYARLYGKSAQKAGMSRIPLRDDDLMNILVHMPNKALDAGVLVVNAWLSAWDESLLNNR
jgi:hypothetical protein